jgi:hypothetical protein
MGIICFDANHAPTSPALVTPGVGARMLQLASRARARDHSKRGTLGFTLCGFVANGSVRTGGGISLHAASAGRGPGPVAAPEEESVAATGNDVWLNTPQKRPSGASLPTKSFLDERGRAALGRKLHAGNGRREGIWRAGSDWRRDRGRSRSTPDVVQPHNRKAVESARVIREFKCAEPSRECTK